MTGAAMMSKIAPGGGDVFYVRKFIIASAFGVSSLDLAVYVTLRGRRVRLSRSSRQSPFSVALFVMLDLLFRGSSVPHTLR